MTLDSPALTLILNCMSKIKIESWFGWLKDKDQTWQSFFFETFVLILVVLFIRFYIFQPFHVFGASMCPTLNQFGPSCENESGEFIFVNEGLYNFVRNPQRGEIVILQPPTEKSKKYIKRVIGVPGDTVQIRDGKVYISNDEYDNFELPESYLSEMNQGHTRTDINIFTVPEGHYLFFGDNRNQSLDSRRCFGNCRNEENAYVTEDRIVGRAEFVLWPINRWRKLDNTPYTEDLE